MSEIDLEPTPAISPSSEEACNRAMSFVSRLGYRNPKLMYCKRTKGGGKKMTFTFLDLCAPTRLYLYMDENDKVINFNSITEGQIALFSVLTFILVIIMVISLGVILRA